MSDGRKNNGGKRKGAGRKPKAYTEFKRRLEKERIEDADYAFWLHSEVMRDDKQPISLRLDCGTWIADRVLGKPVQSHLFGNMTDEQLRDFISEHLTGVGVSLSGGEEAEAPTSD